MLATLTQAHFEALIGHDLAASAGPLAATLRLTSVRLTGQRAPGSSRDPFALDFSGPTAPFLPQQIYRFECDRLGVLELFLVPVGRTADAVLYEAVFS